MIGLLSIVCNFFIKNLFQVLVLSMLLKKIMNELNNYANELLENFRKRKVCSSFKVNI